jgi:hypothetical protein
MRARGLEVSAQISQSGARVNDGNAVRIGERDLQAGGVAAELLKLPSQMGMDPRVP